MRQHFQLLCVDYVWRSLWRIFSTVLRRSLLRRVSLAFSDYVWRSLWRIFSTVLRRSLLRRVSLAFSEAASLLHRHDSFSATTFSLLLLLRDPHCGGVVRGTGPHQLKHIERTRAAYKQDTSPIIISNVINSTHKTPRDHAHKIPRDQCTRDHRRHNTQISDSNTQISDSRIYYYTRR